MVKDALCLTDIRERKWGICHFVSERVLVAFGAVMVADCLIMTPKAFPTKAAFVIANPKAGRAAVRHEGVHAFESRPAGRDVENVLAVSSTAFFGARIVPIRSAWPVRPAWNNPPRQALAQPLRVGTTRAPAK